MSKKEEQEAEGSEKLKKSEAVYKIQHTSTVKIRVQL